MFELVIRVVLSLGVVLGLFWMVARTGSRRLGGRDRALMKVRSRQSLSRGSSLAVVEVGSRVLVVGVSDGGVRLLTELDPRDLDESGAPQETPVFVAARYPVATSARVTTPPHAAEPVHQPVHYPEYPDYPDYAGEYADDFAAGYATYADRPLDDAVAARTTPPRTPTAVLPTRSPAAGSVGGSLFDVAVWRDAWASATGRAHRRADEDAA